MHDNIREYVKELADKKKRPLSVVFLGFGTTNRAIFEAIRGLDFLSITIRQNAGICDTLPRNTALICGKDALCGITDDLIFASPSIRREGLVLTDSSIITSDTEIFFAQRKENLFSVSGSDGKSTVTTLASLLLSPTFPDCFTGGNLGTPIADAKLSQHAFVLELSSFNLRYSLPKGGRAILTNVTPNHLDWHDNLDEYQDCKMRLIAAADEPMLTLSCPFLIDKAKNLSTYSLVSDQLTHRELKAKYSTQHTVTVEYGSICIDGEAVTPVNSVRRHERHNILNMMSAIALTLGYVKADRIHEVAASFTGLEHRCEHFWASGREYIDSSIDTTPDRTAATLEGLGRLVSIILGGRSKGLPLSPMKIPLMKYAHSISVYGEAANEISEWLNSDPELNQIPHRSFDTLKEAIDYADSTEHTVLLSPAATSYGEFKNYVQRGCFFRKYIQEKCHKI